MAAPSDYPCSSLDSSWGRVTASLIGPGAVGSETEQADRCGDQGQTEWREQDGRGCGSLGSDGSPGSPALAVV
ncbi:hypothetical protein A6R68_21968, partial [Neotoma lepida]